MRRLIFAATTLALAVTTPHAAHAFCGFYINGAGSEMFNDATQVVLMRKGTRTVLSMQNNYQGPPDAFAMVIPVPTVLQEADVKTLPADVFGRVDAMGAPRLVEYWEQDPCGRDEWEYARRKMPMKSSSRPMVDMAADKDDDLGVTIEAKFTVGEYQIVILSAKDSSGLETWLRQEKYQIPPGAAPFLKPYVAAGMKFFVAKVDPAKVKFVDGRAALSPLRFHYDSDEFNLPIRLGLANSNGTQDLIVSILAPDQRYEVANYGNVTIPTNLDVKEETKTQFGAFYAALFDRTVEQNPGAVITEYAWDASTCDPCPGPQLDGDDFYTLGADVLGGDYWGLVLTRLHARYGKSDMKADLMFRAAEPIVGGREFVVDEATRKLEERSRPDSTNNFQARYAIRHEWTGPVTCDKPVRGRWGGPPGDQIADDAPQSATNIAFAPRGGVSLPALVKQDIPEIGVQAGVPLPSAVNKAAYPGCTCSTSSGAAGGLAFAGGAGAVLALVLRRRRK